MARDPETMAHQEWLGFVQPVGLVVSIPALLQAQAHVNKNVAPDHQRFLDCLPDDPEADPYIKDFPAFTQTVLGWEPSDLVGADGTVLPDCLEVALPEYNETLRPTYAVPEFSRNGTSNRWIMLVKSLLKGSDFDKVAVDDERRWQASPHSRFERLLRETGVPTGLLFNGTEFRLVYAPRGETSGHTTFRVADMGSVAGRPIFAALHMLLNADRLFSLPEKQRLPAILEDSRKYQNLVSTKLAEQVLAALYELLRGFQAADDARKGELLREVLAEDPNHVYSGLLTTLLRLVFILFAEDRGLLSADPLYVNHYSVTGLFQRLRADAGRFPDTMDQRYGAWAQLLVLFRIIYDGAKSDGFHVPGRKGYLFDPDRYPFLEGRRRGDRRQPGQRLDVPRVSDGVIFRVLSNLLILDGERLSYRTLDVEQIGSVYEAIMGFCLEIAAGRSIAIKPVKSHGAPTTINLEALHETKRADRLKWIRDTTDQKVTGEAADALKDAKTIDDLLAALDKKIAWHVTPNVVPKGAMVLQPSDERRRSGSHYTPRSLTEPIVRKTLEPILMRLRRGNGESGVGDGGKMGGADGRQDQLVPGLAGLASGHGAGGAVLRGNEGISSRRDVRPDQPDSSRRSGDSSEHRGGPRSGTEGIPPISAHCAGKPQGVGNAPDSVSASGDATGKACDGTARDDRPTGSHAPETSAIASPPTPQSLTPTPEAILGLKICDPAMGSGAFLVEACRQLGDELVKAWHVHNCVPRIPPDEDELLHARRVIAQRCLYGVDKNPMAVDLAKLSLWLATLAKDHPFTFLDHALRAGDSLVGLTRQQIADFDWELGDGSSGIGSSSPPPSSQLRSPRKRSRRPAERQLRLGQEHIADRIERATKARKEILDAGDAIPPELKAQKLAVADEAIDTVRFFGDLCVAAFFAGEKDRQRRDLRDEYLDALTEYLRSGDLAKRPSAQVNAIRNPTPQSQHPISPFHWEIEFPEIFSREGGGFDGFIGNPPFAGGRNVSTSSGDRYSDWLATLHQASSGGADLVAHFFRRAFDLLRLGGCFGLIATNTIGQGDTRSTGLRWICTQGGTIYAARKRHKWPGQAAVVVSVIHASRGKMVGPFDLDGRAVPMITAYLFHAGSHENPAVLRANAGKSFQGSIVLGMGFTFDNTDTKGIASPISDMHRLLAKDPKNRQLIYPFVGGEEVNDHPLHETQRHIINYGERSEDEARKWPDLFSIVEQRVKPERLTKDAAKYPRMVNEWWKYWNPHVELYEAVESLGYALVTVLHSKYQSFVKIPARTVFSHALAVFPFDSFAPFAALQARVHELWARFFASSLEDRLRYTPTDCFETFPFSEGFETDPRLEAIGKTYYEFRAALMIRNNEGLTKTYNRFHDPNETSPDIARLRELHAAMDRAVLDAYGWTDIPTDCEFLLDYEDEEEGDGESGMGGGDDVAPHTLLPNPQSRRRSRKKPWRYRWPDDIRDEVLARLLALNAQRAAEERLAGTAGAATTRNRAKRGRSRAGKRTIQDEPLFREME